MGSRIKLRYTRAIIDGIHSGELLSAKTAATPIFDLHVRASSFGGRARGRCVIHPSHGCTTRHQTWPTRRFDTRVGPCLTRISRAEGRHSTALGQGTS